MLNTTSKKRPGGDTRAAAAANGKRVGPKPKGDSPYTRRVLLALSPDQDDSAAAWARQDGVTKQDVIRAALDACLRDKQFL